MGLLSHLNAFLGAPPDQLDGVVLPLVHANLVAYSCAFWMQQPVMPAKYKSLETSEIDVGALQSLSAIVALLGSTVVGRIVDVYGARTGLILGQCSSGILYFILGYSTSVNQLYFSPLPCFFQHAMLCCSAAVAGLSTGEARAAALGRLGLSYGIGMGLGSPVGGKLGLDYAFAASCGLSFLAALLDMILLPRLQASSKVEQESKKFDLSAIYRVAIQPAVLELIIISFSSGLATSAFRAMFALAAVEEYGLDSQDLGYLMSFGAVVGLVTNVFLIGWVVRWFGEALTLALSLLVQSLSFAATAYVGYDKALVVAVSIPQTIASTFFYTLAASLMTKLVSAEEQGTVVSLSHATRSSTQVLAPLLGGYVMKMHKFAGVGLLASTISFLGGIFALSAIYQKPVVTVDPDEGKREEKTRVD